MRKLVGNWKALHGKGIDRTELKIIHLSKAHYFRALRQLVSMRTRELVQGESVMREVPLVGGGGGGG